ncbi:hypothetical protein RB653_010230 [Dictyostelium firmibasis]|uniref:FNIP repeat-containing protein n=1 Tax=Dictyostelium firmibasis TaxID=79012 RepID=A0AAN7TST6_9MYCE
MIFLNNFKRVDFKINTDKEYQYWLDYPYKSYLKRVYFFVGGKNKTKNLQRVLSILESLPENIDTVEIENCRYGPSLNIFKAGFIPNSVTSLELIGFTSTFSKDSIHSNLKTLILSDQISFNGIPFIQCIEGSKSYNSNNSDNKLTYLDFGKKNNSGYSNYHMYPIKKLPNNLKVLLFQDSYDQRIVNGFLPNSLTSLTFGDGFNSSIDVGCLPSSITYLKFGYHFNCIIRKGSLPNELKTLKFGESFNKSLNSEPCFLNTTKLEMIYLGREYESPINKFTFPKSLKILEFSSSCKFNHPIDVGYLPESLETLILGEDSFKSSIKSLPTTLKHLSINCVVSLRNLKPFLKNLEILEFTYVALFSKKLLLQYNDLPTSIKSLKIIEPKLISPDLQPSQSTPPIMTNQLELEQQSLNSLFSKQLLNLTHYEGPYNKCLLNCSSLKSLKITKHFKNQFECGDFSSSIESIEFLSYGNERLCSKVFTKMNNLKSIKFGYYFTHSIGDVIFPNTLTNIELGNGMNEVIDFKIFPNSLLSLKLGAGLNQLTLPNLPESLNCLSIGYGFRGTISMEWLKPSIHHLILSSVQCKFQFPLPKSLTIYTYFNNYNIIENQFYFENLTKNNNLKLCTETFFNSVYANLNNII